MRRLVVIALLALSGACAQIPKPQLASYVADVDSAYQSAKPLIAHKAAAERAAAQRKAAAGAEFPEAFDPDSAASFSTGKALPPASAAWDLGLRSVMRFNQTLAYLAEGRNLAEAQSQMQGLLTDAGALSGTAGLGNPLTATFAGAIAKLVGAVFAPLVEEANRKQFAALAVAAEPEIQALLARLRAETPRQYAAIVDALKDRRADTGLQPADIAEINALHSAFADYVLLLDASSQGIAALAEAAANPALGSPLARAADAARKARQHGEAIETALGGL
jgi:hypothetical protein